MFILHRVDRRITWIAGIVIVITSVSLIAKSPDTTRDTLEVKLVLEGKRFFLGEDEIPVKTVAMNTGKKDCKAALEMGPLSRFIEVQRKDGTRPECLMNFDDMGGPHFKTIHAGGQIILKSNLAELHKIDLPTEYRVRCSALVGNEQVYSKWHTFEVVTGKEKFRKDVKFTRARREGPKAEDASIVVYALAKFHVAYYIRTVEKDQKKTTTYKRLENVLSDKVDPTYDPQVVRDTDGEIHVLIAERQMPEAEVRQQFKEFPRFLKEHLEQRFFVWYSTRASDGKLEQNRRVGVNKHEKKEETPYLRLIKPKTGAVDLHLFSAKGEDLGVYTSPGQKTKQAPTSSPASRDATAPAAGDPRPRRAGTRKGTDPSLPLRLEMAVVFDTSPLTLALRATNISKEPQSVKQLETRGNCIVVTWPNGRTEKDYWTGTRGRFNRDGYYFP